MGACSDRLARFLHYDTVKLVHIKSVKLGLIHLLVQLAIVVYVVVYVIVLNKGYQRSGPVVGSVTLKVKGVTYTGDLENALRVWDAVDVVKPPVEQSAVFVTTNYINTTRQKQKDCGGDGIPCKNDSDCKALDSSSNGILTGTCLNSSTCQVFAWCPMEIDDNTDKSRFLAVAPFTLFARADVEFALFGISRTTANPTPGYVPKEGDPNFFTIDSIVRQTPKGDGSGANWTFADVQMGGAAILASVHWDCDFDQDISLCLPRYVFARLDDPKSSSGGFNYRYGNYYDDKDGTPLRDLYKLFGVRVIFSNTGSGSKFYVVTLVTNFAAGIALITIATVVSDFIALHCLRKREKFRVNKYQDLDSEEEFPLEEEYPTEHTPLISAGSMDRTNTNGHTDDHNINGHCDDHVPA